MLDPATITGIAAVVLGFVLIGLGWRGVAGTLDVQVQLSYLTSGGLSGMVVIGIGCGLLVLQGDRYVDALENRAWQQLARDWRTLGVAVAAMGEALEAEQAAAATDPTQELTPLAPQSAPPDPTPAGTPPVGSVPAVPAPPDDPPAGAVPAPLPPPQEASG